jgi:hypothetical protein
MPRLAGKERAFSMGSVVVTVNYLSFACGMYYRQLRGVVTTVTDRPWYHLWGTFIGVNILLEIGEI